VRHHVAIFVDGRSIRRKDRLDDPLGADAEIHVLQALSGG
jgi:sulfur carrier protein ThiS